MKIHYWLGIIVITSIGFLLARNVHSLSLPENNSSTPAALQSDTGQVQSIALPACPNPQNLDINSLPEQELRAFASYCAYLSLANEDFGTIDSSIDYLRSNKIRTPSGMWLQSLFYAGIEQYLGNANSDVWFMQLEESLQHWIAASKNPDTAHLAMTDLMIHKAWFYRGTGAASEVSTDNFRLFFKQISNAKKYLLEHKSISTRDPEWFSQMLIVTRVEENSSEKTHKQYFDEAVKLFPDYYPVYFSASEFYVTRWGGSDEEFEAFAKYAGHALNPQQAKSIYARIYWAKICSVCGDRDVTAWRSHWNDIQAGFDEIVKDYPDQWNINSYAHIACMGDDREKTLAMMGKIKGPPISDVWSGARDYPSCAEWSGLNKKVKNAKP